MSGVREHALGDAAAMGRLVEEVLLIVLIRSGDHKEVEVVEN